MHPNAVVNRKPLRRAPRSAGIESLEARIAPATFIVTNTSASNVAGSYLFALNQANITPNVGGPDIVQFNIPGTGPFTISPVQAYVMVESVIIDGFTQPGSSPNTLADGDNAVMQIVVNGASAGAVAGLRFTSAADGSTVRGLVMNGYTSTAAIAFDAGSDGNVVEGCFIGMNATGTAAIANSTGISIFGLNNLIGGLTPAARNVISGNSSNGVAISGLGAVGNVIEGNLIGLNATGSADFGNGNDGIQIIDGPNTTIGGSTAAARNVISGNNNNGIDIAGNPDVNGVTYTHDFLILGNRIGTDVTGTLDLGNNSDGIRIFAAPVVTIRGNLVSGNGGHGIDISGGFDINGNRRTHDVAIEGNTVGLNAAATAKLANGLNGLNVAFSEAIDIGGATAAERNVFSGNGSDGVYIDSSVAITIVGNFLGPDATGTVPLGNAVNGLRIVNSANLTIGGTATGAGNVMSGNAYGAYITGISDFSVQGNFIGTDLTGFVALGNSVHGMQMSAAHDGLIGGTVSGARNIFAGNTFDGLYLLNQGLSNVRVFGNYLGVNATGTGALGNGGVGLEVSSESVIVGGTGPGEANVIAYNGRGGVYVYGVHDIVRGNSIHDNVGIGIDLGFLGVTPNDLQDTDTGSQNFPLLLSAASNVSGTTVTGFINTNGGAPLLLDFYADDVAGVNGFGQGRQYLGTVAVGADGYGNANFTAQLPTVAAGKFITATATSIGYAPFGDTSEFSQTVAVTAAPVSSGGSAGSGSGPSVALAGFDVGSGSIGVAAGDVNGDGFDDLVTANAKSGTVSVLLSNGLGGFADAVDYKTGGLKPAGLVLGKFNGDNFLDIAVTNAGSGSVALLAGAGDGSFGAASTFPVGKTPGAVLAANLDGDGFLDLACIIAGGKVAVISGNGAGNFAPPTNFTVGKSPVALVVGDFNDDGHTDLATANSAGNNVSVLRGDGTGSFAAAPLAKVGTKPVALTVGDFNDDGVDDLAVAHGTSRFVSVLLSRGAASGAQFTAQAKIPYPGLKGARAIVASDVDGDGRTDLIVANGIAGSYSLLLGRGTGLFRGPFETQLSDDPIAVPVSIALGDFDGDGRKDFAISELNANDVIVAFRQS